MKCYSTLCTQDAVCNVQHRTNPRLVYPGCDEHADFWVETFNYRRLPNYAPIPSTPFLTLIVEVPA